VDVERVNDQRDDHARPAFLCTGSILPWIAERVSSIGAAGPKITRAGPHRQ
jgi:hypothetical protein